MRFTLVPAAALLLGCGGPILPGTQELAITTDRAAYVAESVGHPDGLAEYEFQLTATVENVGTGTVFLERCRPEDPRPTYAIELLDAPDQWGSAFNPTWGCAGHDAHIRIDPGERLTFTFAIRGPNAWDGHTHESYGALNGEMRLCIANGVSNVFSVVSPEL